MKYFFFLSLFLLIGTPLVAVADPCDLVVESNDQMQFNTKLMEVPASCTKVKVTLKHVGKFPKEAMGHNWVLVKTADLNAVGAAGASAGIDNHYVPQNDPRVLASTTLIGGGEETSVEFDLSKLDPAEKYSFLCSFPGHYSIMKGDFVIKS